jgi:hypothetical protein
LPAARRRPLGLIAAIAQNRDVARGDAGHHPQHHRKERAMALVALTCTLCGATDHVPVGAVLATVNVDGLEVHLAGVVTWMCDGCGQVVSETVGWHSFLLLLTDGVSLLDDDPSDDPARALPPHPEQPRDGADFIRDDLLILHELLATDTWFDQLRARTHP